MCNIVIGTAGHIDHGKTTLIKNLTNIDTDTLIEEKKRGITIDLGFAYLTMPNGKKISIIDVPGHEKFIKNMIAGSKGIDFVLFLIACDDGIMPQTIEHKEILKLMNIKHGIVILSKTDLVTKEKINILKNEISTFFNDNYFNNFPIIETSSKNPESFSNLYNIIISQIKKLNISKVSKDFKLDIDKFYSIKGVGTVVSGTSIGSISKNDFLTLYPQNVKVKVKNLEVHGQSRDFIKYRTRCAINISNINSKDISRGNFLSNFNNFILSNIFDISFKGINNSIPANNTKIRLHIGTGEYFGKIKYIHSNFNNFIFFQLVMEKSIYIRKNEIGIIRSLESLSLLGNIKILQPKGSSIKKDNVDYIKNLQNIYFDKVIENKNILNDSDSFTILTNKIIDYILNFHSLNHLLPGISNATIKNIFFPSKEKDEFNAFINFLVTNSYLKIEDGIISHPSFKIKLTKKDLIIKEKIFSFLKNKKFVGSNYGDIQSFFKNEPNFLILFRYFIKNGFFIEIEKNRFVLSGFIKEAIKILNYFMETHETISLSQFRDSMNISRKYALMYLNYFDCEKITIKTDDIRTLK